MSKLIKYALRMTHIDNIPHILACGFVLSNSPSASKKYIPIGDQSIISTRWAFSKYNLKEYIPFYFGPRTPMLYVIQRGYNGVTQQKAEDIVYCVVRIEDIVKSDIECLFTDGHAIDGLTKYYAKKELENLNTLVKYDDVFAKFWADSEDTDKKRRKEAELLVKTYLPIEFVYRYIVYNDVAQKKLIGYGIDEDNINIYPKAYF